MPATTRQQSCNPVPVLVFDQPRYGHRRRGLEVLAKVLGGVILMEELPAAWTRLLRWPGAVVFQTADGYLAAFLLLCIGRSALGRRSVGIVFRDRGATGWKPWLRNWLTARIRRVPGVEILSVIAPEGPDSAPGDWIYDIEWWDLAVWPLADCATGLPEAPVVLGIGTVGRHKGLDFFLTAARAARGRNIRFVLAGDAQRLTQEERSGFLSAGGLLMPPPASDAEFVSCIRHADWIWCCYAAGNDKSSGIFGRALQLGKRTIVRRASYLQPFQERFGRGVAVAFGDVDALLTGMERVPNLPVTPDALPFATYSINRLRQACGLAPDTEGA